ncbi:hypothetical protein [Gordonia sp. SID5947]|uniref:hypothetical protein n=1 Tax=Gordonia sp. SID5947 TaxID=2690315 RepID=UPI001F20EB4F|nr:hypothetical protein [Gordonia sp. SID5947]
MGLRLSDDEEVVSCETYPSFPDSSVKVMVRTRSPETRSAFLKRCDASEELGRSLISFDDGPFHEEVRRPNLTRSEQVFIADTHGYNELRLSYDEGVESGLLITVWAIDM